MYRPQSFCGIETALRNRKKSLNLFLFRPSSTFVVALESLMGIRMEVRACPTEFWVRFQAIFSCLRTTSYAKIKTTSATIRAANVIRDSNV